MKKLLLFTILAGSIGLVRANTYVFTPPSHLALDHSQYYTWGISDFSIPSDQEICEAVLTFTCINNWTADEDTVLPKWGWVSHVEGHGRHAHLVKTWEIIGYTAPVAKNWLHSWLLDSADNTSRAGTEERAAPGKVVAYGDTDDGPDNFTSWVRSDKAYIGTYTDDHGGPGGDLVTLTYTFSTLGLVGDLAKFVDHGSDFALGFDPDCHYDYRCASFVIKTCKRPHVPDGGTTLALLGFGLVALSSFKRLLHA